MIQDNDIRLRAIEEEDLPRFVAWLNDPEVYQHLEKTIPLSTAHEALWYQDLLKKPMEEHPLVIEIDTPDGWFPVGDVSFININWRDRSAEIGIFIGEKKFWNQKYGQKAMRTMLRHGFFNLNLNRIYLRVYETNPRAIRAYEQTGFVHEGRLRQAKFQNGKYIDVLLMSVLRTEWQDREENREYQDANFISET